MKIGAKFVQVELMIRRCSVCACGPWVIIMIFRICRIDAVTDSVHFQLDFPGKRVNIRRMGNMHHVILKSV